MNIPFVKMHGLGNDFVVIDQRKVNVQNPKALAKSILDRRLGVGGDTMLLIESSDQAKAKMRVIEKDGFEPQNCGNGLRCVARLLCEDNTNKLNIETMAGIMETEVLSNQHVKVKMPKPKFERSSIPVLHDSPQSMQLHLLGRIFDVCCLSMGNPHALVFVKHKSELDMIEVYGPLIENHEWFSQKTNVEFAFVLNSHEVLVRVWERSAGLTMACGTGACAVAVAGILKGLLTSPVSVHFAFGALTIDCDQNFDVYMTGSAHKVFEGVYDHVA